MNRWARELRAKGRNIKVGISRVRIDEEAWIDWKEIEREEEREPEKTEFWLSQEGNRERGEEERCRRGEEVGERIRNRKRKGNRGKKRKKYYFGM